MLPYRGMNNPDVACFVSLLFFYDSLLFDYTRQLKIPLMLLDVWSKQFWIYHGSL